MIEEKLKSQSSRRGKGRELAMIACILLSAVCLAPRLASIASSTPAVASSTHASSTYDSVTESLPPRLITKPIEEIRCGDRIPSELPEGLLPEDEAEPDPATWRLVELTVEKQDGTIVEVKLLRPLAWLEQAGAIRNGHFDLAVAELDIEGRAAVLDIKPCPPIQGGEGQVVTGTFRHSSDDLVALHIQGEPEPIVCTSGHRFWSETSGSFVEASKLQPQESVFDFLGRKGSLTAVTRLSDIAPVFNLEVSQSHVYHVSTQGIRVHNANGNRECGSGSDDASKSLVDDAIHDPARLWGKTPDEIADAFRREGFEAIVEQSTKGSKRSVQVRISGHSTISNIQVHPGGGVHSGPYIKISTSKWGKIKVVDPSTYREVINRNLVGGLNIEDATIIETIKRAGG